MRNSGFGIQVFILFICLLLSSTLRAQITNVTNDTSTPVPGAGHNYIHMLSETVNPANGSVSLRIQVPTPKGRGIAIPFSFAYDSNGVHHVLPGNPGQAFWQSNAGYLSQGGWNYGVPLASLNFFNVQAGNYPNYYQCQTYTGYMFEDPSGGQHALGLGTQYSQGVGQCPGPGVPSHAGGDPQVAASLPLNYPDVYNPAATAPWPITVYAADGTVYNFSTSNHQVTANSDYFFLPTYIEDRNGNKIVVTDNANGNFVFTDTAGRQAISSNGFGPSGTTNTLSFSGLTYYVTWKTTTATFTVPSTRVGDDGVSGCLFPSASDSPVVVSKITLPNGQFYQFYYGNDNPDPSLNNPYGLLSEIIYPTGGWVKYTWGLSATLNEFTDFPGAIPNGMGGDNPSKDGCLYEYKTPVVTSRSVGFGGSSTPSLTQTFVYSTTWTSVGTTWTGKTTTVTTTDAVQNTSAQTVYAYLPVPVLPVPLISSSYPGQIPVESTTNYYDWGSSTNPLRTETKYWYDQYNLQEAQISLNGNSPANTTYCYVGSICHPNPVLSQLQKKSETDFGGTLLRTTSYTYQSFVHTPSAIGDMTEMPCSIVVADGAGNTVAETDSWYDGSPTTTVCGSVTPVALAAVTGFPNPTHDDANYGPSSTAPRGNATTVSQKCLQSCSNSVTALTYDETGQLVKKIDACGNTTCSDMTGTNTNHATLYIYTDDYDAPPATNTNAYLTKVTNALGQSTSFKYAYSDGQLIQSTDPNGQSTGFLYADSLRRLTETDDPDGGKTTHSYIDTPPSPSVTTTTLVSSGAPSVSITKTSVVDGLGHVTQTQITTDPDGVDFTDLTYDGFGRAWKQSNPHRSAASPTDGTTTTYTDALGRICLVVPPDGTLPSGNACPTTQPSNTVLTAYSGNTTTVTDQAGKSRKSVTDGLGRLSQVTEDPTGLGYVTTYSYNVLDDLIGVVQNGSRQRSFNYDSLSRLLCASNPESSTAPCPTTATTSYTPGTTGYSYDANGNLSSKTALKPNQSASATIVTTYSYDPLNRLAQKSYNDGVTATVKYGYDAVALTGCATPPPTLTDSYPVGLRTAMCDGAGAESWAHDVMGRVSADDRITNGISKTINYTYNLDGSLATNKIPNGPYFLTYAYQMGGAGRQIGLTENGSQLIQNAQYTPTGQLCFVNRFWSVQGYTTNTFNNRLQPVTTYSVAQYPGHAGSPPVPAACAVNAVIPPSGYNINELYLTYNYVDANGHNNGNVASITNNLDSTRSQTFTYDSLNRVATAQTTSTHATSPTNCWQEGYFYDNLSAAGGAWGNLTTLGVNTQSAYVGCSGEVGVATTVNSKNQLAFLSYDAAGNVTNNPNTFGGSYTYDAENRLTNYTYGSNSVNYAYDGDGKRVLKSTGTLYWYGTNSAPIVETDLANNMLSAYFFFNGERSGRHLQAGNEIDYYVGDHLGNTRFLWSLAGYNQSDFYPFGGERFISAGTTTNYKFTGKERDSESGNDYFGARHYASSMGRWLSPDRLNMTDDRLEVPSNTLNKYVYGANNPFRFVDPDGRDIVALYDPPHGVRPGHFMLFANNQQTGESAMMSFGPTDQSAAGTAITAVGGFQESTKTYDWPQSADDLRQNFAALSIQTTPEQAQEVINFINNLDPSSTNYKLFSQNCTTVCRDALKIVGLVQKNNGSITPAGLWKQLTSRYLNQSHRYDIRTQHKGVDYGNPRFGMNTFDFLWLQLKPPQACTTIQGPNGPETHCVD